MSVLVLICCGADNPLTERLLDGDLLAESLKWVSSFQLFKLDGRVLVQELVDGEVAAADLDLNLVTFNLDHDTARAELVDTFRLAHEHDLELLAVWVVIDVLRQLFVRWAVLNRDVDGDASLEVNDVRLESFNFHFTVPQVGQEIKCCLVRFVDFVFELGHVVCGVDHVALQGALGRLALAELRPQH